MPREKEAEQEGNVAGKTMVILAKPHQQSSQGDNAAPKSPTHQVEAKTPTVLQKSREVVDCDGSRAASPAGVATNGSGSAGSAITGSELANAQQPVYHIQQKNTLSSIASVIDGEQKLSSFVEMTSPVKLVDESLQWCDNAMEFLQDQTDFCVVGVLGLQGSGKSTVLSALSGQYGDEGERQLFKPQTREICELGEHCTIGIDIYVTSERLILLDTQPVLSASIMDHMIQYEKKLPGGADYYSTENALQIQSLQMAAFLMTVCHIIILVQDWFVDPNLLRFILSTEMLKPATPTNPNELAANLEDPTEYYPNLVFLQNKCSRVDFSPSSVKAMQSVLQSIFQKSKLKYKGLLSMDFMPCKEDSAQDAVNLFLLPMKEYQDQDIFSNTFPEYRGHPGFSQLVKSLTYQVLSMPRSMLTHTALSEKNWFHYAARIWETVKKLPLFLEYSRLLP